MNSQQWRFCLVTGLFWFSVYTYVPILPIYAASLGASYKLIGLIVGSYGITQLLLRIPQGLLSDRWRKRKVFVVAAMAVAGVSAAGMWLIPDATALLVFRGLSGVSSTAWVVIVVLFASYFPANETSKAFGILNSVNFTGQLVGMLTGGLAADWYGPQAAFLLGAGGAVAGLALSLTIRETMPAGNAVLIWSDLVKILGNFYLLLASGLGILIQFLVYGTVFGFVPLLAKQLGASGFELGLLTTLSVAPGIVASMLSGTWFARTLGTGRSICLGFLLLAVSTAAVPWLTSLTQLCVSQLVGGFGRGLAFPLLMALGARSVGETARATAMGVFQSLYALGMFAGPVAVGVIGDWAGLNAGFWLCSLCGLAGAAIAWRYAGGAGQAGAAVRG